MKPALTFLLSAILCAWAAADPVISEFCASNQNGLQDENGDRPDWIEIHNPDATTADLTGWHLTDSVTNLAKWRFPATTIPAKGYLVVFASSKNRAVAGQPLHTNFSLSADGEFLALVKTDGVTTTSVYSPSFPIQYPNISYGTPNNTVTSTPIAPSSTCRWIVPTSAINPDFSTWRNVSFTDSAWNSATQGIGFDRNTAGVNYLTEIGSGGNTESAMYGIRATAYLRIPFTVADPASVTKLTLRVKYDDGFAFYLNGSPLLASGVHLTRNAPSSLAWNSAATATHDDSASIIYVDFDVTENKSALLTGNNLLAVHVLNQSTTSSDLVFRTELIAESTGGGSALPPGYFATPTPGSSNGGPATMVIPQNVTFSTPAGTFSNNFGLTLSGAISGQVIRYTTDGTVPTGASTLYSAPITISATTLVRARIFDATTGAPGLTCGCHYEKLDATLTSYASTGQPFKSSLPVILLNNRGGGEIANDNIYRDVRLHVIDRAGAGYSTITSSTALSIPAAAKIRGSSSANFAKKSYGIEFRDESGENRSHSLLGMPASDDWALISCYDFDRAFMRNAWIYEMARQAGIWSPRTRFVEVYFNQDGDNLEYADYRGVYLLCENVRAGTDRADITAIEPGDLTQPGVSGGYIFKVDRFDVDEYHWQTTRGLPVNTTGNMLCIHRPKLADLPTAQSNYLVQYFQQFEDALYTDAAGGFATRNYQNFIDSASWADHNIFNMFGKNVDALRLSAYFLKDRGRKITGGPLWDFDRSANSTDSRDDAYNTWVGTGDGTNYFTYAWWANLFADVEFRQTYVDRWQALRRGPFVTSNFQSLLDSYLAEFRVSDADNPSTRDYARWYGSSTSNNLTTETANLKTWLANRAAWVDSQFCTAPTTSPAAGPVPSGQTVTLTVPSGTTVYYTTNGSDPRAVGGGVSPSAIAYTGVPITLTSTKVITARAFRSGTYTTPATNWSGPATSLYTVNEPYASASSLRVTAINYNPLAPDTAETAAVPDLAASDFEWIELTNISATTINLDGVQLAKGSPVSAVTLTPRSLAPGERALIVKHRAAFTLRYGATAAQRIAAEWTGDQSLDNGGETIWIADRGGNTIAYFAYDDDGIWPGRADGLGSAIEYTGTSQETIDYQNGNLWRSGLRVHGTPGESPSAVPSGVVFNEILATAISPGLAAIEFVNTSSLTVDLGGWYLSDTPEPPTADGFRKFRFPAGTLIAPGGHLVLTEQAFNPNGSWNPNAGTPSETEFALDGYRGGTLWLVSGQPATSQLINYEDKLEYTPTLAGVSHGRYPDGTGDFVPLAEFTSGDPNGNPRIGEIQVSEIMYHPAGTPEYLEIVNTSGSALTFDQWTLRGTVDFDFLPATTLDPGETALIVAFDPVLNPSQATAFRTTYGVPATVSLLGPWQAPGTLGNTTGTVRLRRRVPAPAEDPVFVGLMTEDEVIYQNSAPWPTGASGTGAAIHRLGIRRWGNDPTAWTATTPNPGSDAGGYQGWQRTAFPSGSVATAPNDDPDGDGLPNAIEYLLGTAPDVWNGLLTGTALASGNLPARLYLNYTRRLDRDDYALTALQSDNLTGWEPADHDESTGVSDLIESRQAWIPLSENRGFLRLEATPAE